MPLRPTDRHIEKVLQSVRDEAAARRSLAQRIYPNLKPKPIEPINLSESQFKVGRTCATERRNKMSRFQLTAACSDGAFRFRAGTKLADSTANALPGDKINATLCATPFAGMVPLDAAAVTALAGVGINTSIGALIVPVTGVSSVDA